MNGITTLVNLIHERECLRYPNMPPAYIPKKKYDVKKSNGLTKAIIDFINIQGGMAERIGNTGRYLQGDTVTDVIGIKRVFKGKYIPGTGTNGTADISATYKGKSLKIEVKIGADRQSDAQKEYEQRVTDAGGIYVIAKDFEGFYLWWCGVFK